MISLNTWNTLFEGKYGDQELNILYNEDIFVSFLRLRDKTNALIQVYKVFVVKGEVETFASTLPYPVIVYHKHVDIGSSNNFKYLLLHTNTEYVDLDTLSYHVDKKITELNKMVSAVISVIKSYDVKLISLKHAGEKDHNYFFSDPDVIKSLTNLPLSLDTKSSTSLDKLILGKKKDIKITTSLTNLNSVFVYGPEIEDRSFISKIVCENFLLSSKIVIVFDPTNSYLSLGYPQQNPQILMDFDLNMDPFGFPIRKINYKDLKIPLNKIPLNAFLNLFNFKEVSIKILKEVYNDTIVNFKDLIANVKKVKITNEINEFEIQRVVSKLLILDKKYESFFGKTDVSILFKQRYKNIGSIKLIEINKKDPFHPYFIKSIIDEISISAKDDILLVFPELSNVFNNIYLGDSILKVIKENTILSSLFVSKYVTDFRDEEISTVKISSISGNDGVIYYPNRDPIRILFRPSFTSSVIKYKI